MIFDLLN